ncbi:hypothetical protein HY629_00965 [Candidatus Uhrbacteria bacterium]|nr:hypothetical protein [Candidatus Uhrbacteria bacterium]
MKVFTIDINGYHPKGEHMSSGGKVNRCPFCVNGIRGKPCLVCTEAMKVAKLSRSEAGRATRGLYELLNREIPDVSTTVFIRWATTAVGRYWNTPTKLLPWIESEIAKIPWCCVCGDQVQKNEVVCEQHLSWKWKMIGACRGQFPSKYAYDDVLLVFAEAWKGLLREKPEVPEDVRLSLMRPVIEEQAALAHAHETQCREVRQKKKKLKHATSALSEEVGEPDNGSGEGDDGEDAEPTLEELIALDGDDSAIAAAALVPPEPPQPQPEREQPARAPPKKKNGVKEGAPKTKKRQPQTPRETRNGRTMEKRPRKPAAKKRHVRGGAVPAGWTITINGRAL